MDCIYPALVTAPLYAGYSSDPALDAARHFDRLDLQDAAYEQACQDRMADIVGLFTKVALTKPADQIQLPEPGRFKGGRTVASEACELLDYERPGAALMAVLKDSKCPLVAAMREAMGQQYAELVVDELVKEQL